MTPKYPRVAVIGAGISGVLAAAHLRRAGIDAVVFERSAAPGGIWYVVNPPMVLEFCETLADVDCLRLYDEQTPLEPAYPSDIPSLVEYFQGDAVSVCDEYNQELKSLEHAPPG